MTKSGEEGYILASALAVLLAISLVAAALVSTSVDVVRRAKRAETDAAADLALRSAVLVVTSQLSEDPRRRQLAFEGVETIDAAGLIINAKASWESLKLDMNLAPPEAIEQRLQDAGMDQETRSAVLSAIQTHRSNAEPIRLLDDVLPKSADWTCLRSILTIFGGRPDYNPDEQAQVFPIGRPAAGARVSIDAWLANEPAKGVSAIVIMTGNPAAPAKVLDWRRIRTGGEERCNDTHQT
jgi:hypothetical protein